MSKIVFSVARSRKNEGKLEKDKDGYYKVILGSVNMFNSSGEFYIADGIEEFIKDKNSRLHQRLTNGKLKGENTHPVPKPGQSKAAIINRQMKIDQKNVSHFIREVWFEPSGEKTKFQNREIIDIYGWVKPIGPHGPALEKELEDPNINVSFSIRSLASQKMVNGITVKTIQHITTWDWVHEQGIARADKFNTIANECEDLTLATVDTDELEYEGEIKECVNCALEDKDQSDVLKEVIGRMKSTSGKTDLTALNKW